MPQYKVFANPLHAIARRIIDCWYNRHMSRRASWYPDSDFAWNLVASGACLKVRKAKSVYTTLGMMQTFETASYVLMA